ncbi:hypothetical protein MM221_04960 [Salipaludibacillus sp. LMS25]|uniref:hypothetical protein n=1 Tax=Salipaludibacillus sp. LMS25 TaxID=2924031 RepID=UPI0020D0E49B|nr:hypothetical protein [Salipaludibacillus sp. LMS25]UTR15913.1 hypothetical protein MM221_04960 [Salipaludibacillus sp. LMS25]
MFKNVYNLTAFFTILLLSSFTTSALAEEPSDYLSTPESYIDYLTNFDKEEALELGVDPRMVPTAVGGASEIKEEFEKLSVEDQELFLEYMRNPEELIEDTLSGEDENLEFEIVEEEEPMYMTPSSPMSGYLGVVSRNTKARSRTVSHTGTMKTLGVTWIEYKITGDYEYNSKKATKHLSTRAFVNKNYNPTVATEKTSEQDILVVENM